MSKLADGITKGLAVNRASVQKDKRRARALSVTITVLALAGTALLPPAIAVANEESDDTPVVLAVGQTDSFVTESGVDLSVTSDSDEAGDRRITAQSPDGVPVNISIQSVPIGSLDALREPLAGVAPAEFYEEDPGPVVETRASEPLSTEPSEWEVTAAMAVTPTTATFRWDSAVGEFEAYLDGVSTETSEDGALSLDNLAPATDYVVELRGTITGPRGETLSSEKTIQLHTLGTDDASTGAAARTFQQYTTAFMHKTFIPPASVDGSMCNFGNSAYTFRGDNRGFRVPTLAAPFEAHDYRSMMFANVNWDNPAPYDVITVADVGQSVTLLNGAVQHASYASTSGMLFEEIQSAGAYAQVRFNHSAANPHCKLLDVNYGGVIRYNEIVRFYRAGIVEVVGYRQQAPAHEGYARFNTASGTEFWTTMFRLDNAGFHCLVEPLCATQTINYSKSY